MKNLLAVLMSVKDCLTVERRCEGVVLRREDACGRHQLYSPQGVPIHTRGSKRLQSSHMYRQRYLTFWCSSRQKVKISRRYRRNLVVDLGIRGRKSDQLRIEHSVEASPLAERSPALIVTFIRSCYSATISSREIPGLGCCSPISA
jgi:hypothetical protein